jgi:hypothetical protein
MRKPNILPPDPVTVTPANPPAEPPIKPSNAQTKPQNTYHSESSPVIPATPDTDIRQYEFAGYIPNPLDSIMEGREYVFNSENLPSRKTQEFSQDENVEQQTNTAETKNTGQTLMAATGFRLQVFTTTDFEELKKKSWELKPILGRTPAYILYNAPYYKLRVGDFCDKDDTYGLSQKLQEEGFEASVVPSPVQVKAKCQ